MTQVNIIDPSPNNSYKTSFYTEVNPLSGTGPVQVIVYEPIVSKFRKQIINRRINHVHMVKTNFNGWQRR